MEATFAPPIAVTAFRKAWQVQRARRTVRCCAKPTQEPITGRDSPKDEALSPSLSSVPNRSPGSSARVPYTLRTRLREETEAPFRKVRQFIFVGSGMSAAVGAFVSALRVAAALSGVRGVQPLSETSQNLAVNLAAIGVCALLWKLEQDAGARRLERMSRGARIARLRVEDSTSGKAIQVGDLRSQYRVVIVAGPAAMVAATLQEASAVRDDLKKRKVKVVPLVVDSGLSEDFTSGGIAQTAPEQILGTWIARPLDSRRWLEWLESEKELSSKSKLSSDEVYVIIVKLNGKVGSRTIGAPQWSALIAEAAKFSP